ncbi:MAG: nucleotidyl transferase AbiEii/AbiGii toxin family protein [Alphaproteobacteria bacterium]
MIQQVNAATPIIEHWTLGGGTALMLRIDHRESRDIDIFVTDPQQLAFLDPTRRDFAFEIQPSAQSGDGANFVKLTFADLGEIDFIAGVALTSPVSTAETIHGEPLELETVAEIIAKKIHHRGSMITPRDIFDIAAAGEQHTDAVVAELRKLKSAVDQTISALEKLNPEFVRQANSELAIRPAFAAVAESASERAMEILLAVD